MTHEEAKKIVRILCASYPNWKPMDIKDTVEAWEMMLSDYEYQDVAIAVKTIVTTDSSGFAPSIGKVIDEIHKLSNLSLKTSLSGIQAWDMVRKAVKRGAYNSEEEFAKLPPTVQKAVGSAGCIHDMAVDTNLNLGVEQSHFLRAYERAVQDEEYEAKLPKEVKALLGGIGNGNVSIGNKEKVLAIGEQMAADNNSVRTE